MSLNKATTATGSVVETIAASSRQATREYDEKLASPKPMTSVDAITATTARRKIGTTSSSRRRTSISIAVSNSSMGRNR